MEMVNFSFYNDKEKVNYIERKMKFKGIIYCVLFFDK